MFTWGERVMLFVMLLLVVIMSTGSHCNTRDTLTTIRRVHMGVREAGHLVDDQIAMRLERQGDICIERAEAAGFSAGSGEEGFAYWRQCMEQLYQLVVAVNTFRSSLEELENIYQDVEAGERGESDWEYWARRVLDHGRTVLRLARELDVGFDSTTVETLQNQLDVLCRLLRCDEEADQ